MHREDLLKKAGKMVIVYYHKDEHICFAIGWFYAMDRNEVKLKVTSTRFETYESIAIELDYIDKIEDYDITD